MRVGIVIPTVFARPMWLPLSIDSVTSQRPSPSLLLGCPKNLIPELRNLFKDVPLIAEPRGAALATKINNLIDALPEDCEYVGWLGDDDILLPSALQAATKVLDDNPDVVMVYGGCDYISSTGEVLFTNRSSQSASALLKMGPQLIPQPGSLWRRKAFEKVGGLSSDYSLAFDFDLFLKLSKEGRLHHVPKTLAQFRWHKGSMSVRHRLA
jgi:GT2 family glycosyltransferase